MRFLISFGMTKNECHCEATKLRGNPILTTTEKSSLRAPERCVAISLFAIHKCLNEIPRFTRGNASLLVYD